MVFDTDSAFVPPRKLTDYLLNLDHPVGGPKAAFFWAHGYDESSVGVLEEGLLHIVATEPIADFRTTPFEANVTVVGDLSTPRGTTVRIRTVWYVRAGDPRAIAYSASMSS